MKRFCMKCAAYFEDDFRTTVCPHETFLANDGKNNFRHHPESLLIPPPPPRTVQKGGLPPAEGLGCFLLFVVGVFIAIALMSFASIGVP